MEVAVEAALLRLPLIYKDSRIFLDISRKRLDSSFGKAVGENISWGNFLYGTTNLSRLPFFDRVKLA